MEEQSNSNGFTLMELMITVIIVSILATLSYPLYTHHLVKSRRVEAKVTLLNLAMQMEHYFFLHHTYIDASSEFKNFTEHKYYQLVNKITENTYLLQAVPLNSQMHDYECGTFSLNELGEKSISGYGKIIDCW